MSKRAYFSLFAGATRLGTASAFPSCAKPDCECRGPDKGTNQGRKMKVNRTGVKESATKAVNRLPKKWRNRFDASLIQKEEAKVASKESDATWIAVFFSYGLN